VLEETAEAAGKKIAQHRAASDSEIVPEESRTRRNCERRRMISAVAGRLRESAEGFRRALIISPRDPWLIYEFARLLRSQASALGEARMLSRACAACAWRLSGARMMLSYWSGLAKVFSNTSIRPGRQSRFAGLWRSMLTLSVLSSVWRRWR